MAEVGVFSDEVCLSPPHPPQHKPIVSSLIPMQEAEDGVGSRTDDHQLPLSGKYIFPGEKYCPWKSVS